MWYNIFIIFYVFRKLHSCFNLIERVSNKLLIKLQSNYDEKKKLRKFKCHKSMSSSLSLFILTIQIHSVQNLITHIVPRANFNLIFYSYYIFSVTQANSTINFTIINYELQGNLSEMRPFKLSDINLCNKYAAYPQTWQQNVKFARNFFTKCAINLREFIALQPDTKFSTLYLNYYENQANFLQTVPILIRNAYKVNEVSIWLIIHPCNNL